MMTHLLAIVTATSLFAAVQTASAANVADLLQADCPMTAQLEDDAQDNGFMADGDLFESGCPLVTKTSSGSSSSGSVSSNVVDLRDKQKPLVVKILR